MTPNTWRHWLKKEQRLPYYQDLQAELNKQTAEGTTIYPPPEDRLRALSLTSPAQCRVIILGQDPYHSAGQAHGLAFSVPRGITIPPSLKNIFKALSDDLKLPTPESGDLTPWAKQGVLLLNTTLTVIAGSAHSHARLGWEHFTDHLIQYLNAQTQAYVFMLWGAHALRKKTCIDSKKHLVLTAPHPSPLSAYRGFMSCGHFSKANAWLEKQYGEGIDWRL